MKCSRSQRENEHKADGKGYEKGSEVPLTVKEQVQVLIEDATDPKNLAQGERAVAVCSFHHEDNWLTGLGYVLGWIPQW